MLTTTLAPQFETHYTPEPRNRMRLLAHPYLIADYRQGAHHGGGAGQDQSAGESFRILDSSGRGKTPFARRRRHRGRRVCLDAVMLPELRWRRTIRSVTHNSLSIGSAPAEPAFQYDFSSNSQGWQFMGLNDGSGWTALNNFMTAKTPWTGIDGDNGAILLGQEGFVTQSPTGNAWVQRARQSRCRNLCLCR